MSDPKIGGREPVTVQVVEGETYWWCRCGRSQTPAVLRRLPQGHRLRAAGMDRQTRRAAQFLHLQAHQDAAVLRQQPLEAIVEPLTWQFERRAMPLWIILAIVAATVIYAVVVFNSLVRTRQMANEAWSGIDVQLKRRSDLVPNLVDSVKGYAAHERSVLEDVTQKRGAARALPEGDVGGARAGGRRAVGRARPADRAGRELSRPEGERQFPRIAAAVERRWRTSCRWRGATTTAPCATSTCWCNPFPAI